MSREKTKKSLGEQLLSEGLIEKAQLDRAEREAERAGEPLRKTLVRLAYVSEAVIMSYMAQDMNIPFISLQNFLIPPELVSLVPEPIARKYNLIPVFNVGDSLTVAMSDPMNIFATDELRLKTKLNIETCLALESEIKNAINQYYSVSHDMGKVIESIEAETGTAETEMETNKLESLSEEAPVIKLVNMFFLEAVREGASDIHVEPEENFLRIRFRVDGVMREFSTVPRKLKPAIASRIKIMAGLDIAERRAPQDGRFQMRAGQKKVEVRVSVLPTIYGENVVCRLLDNSQMALKLPDLGLNEQHFNLYAGLVKKTYGIILITGPTGSGKTTTLYASLNEINDIEKNIVTIEDPVEYRLPMIRQIQVNNKAELTFAKGLRSVLRQDPDIIMVGEIRDEETARIAVQAALTGHLVFSTVHTNDAAGTITRLIDMGIEPFLVASSIVGLVAQRLIRVLCKECKAEYAPSKEEAETLSLAAGTKLFKPVGCNACRKIGYKGRIAIFEMFIPDGEMRRLIVKRASSDEIKNYAIKQNMRTLKQDAFEKVKAGVTSLEEALRVTQD